MTWNLEFERFQFLQSVK